MRTPKAQAGFVPVDSEEARKIEDKTVVNYAYVNEAGMWMHSNGSWRWVKERACNYKSMHYHVQLPPPVEWEEVWGITSPFPLDYRLTKKGVQVADLSKLESNEVAAIVRALNEMEGGDG